MEADNSTMKSNDQRSTCIDNVRQFASRLAYLLSVASLSHSRWPTISTIKQQSTNKIIYPEIKHRKTIVRLSGGSRAVAAATVAAAGGCREEEDYDVVEEDDGGD